MRRPPPELIYTPIDKTSEAVAEDEAAYEAMTHTVMAVPVELVPLVRELISKQRRG
jgi:hypothetical protein